MTTDKVLVTGFGPFGNHSINASWEAVKLLPNYSNEEIELIAELVPVTYADVDEKVKTLRGKYNPKLVIHVGVSDLARQITLETQACRQGYVRSDCIGQLHPTGKCCQPEEGNEVICCEINVAQICNEINEKHKKITCTSDDAGRYLCEYIFYKSLHIDNKRTMFIHVPPLNEPFTKEDMADCLFLIVKAALRQIQLFKIKRKVNMYREFNQDIETFNSAEKRALQWDKLRICGSLVLATTDF